MVRAKAVVNFSLMGRANLAIQALHVLAILMKTVPLALQIFLQLLTCGAKQVARVTSMMMAQSA
jgi:hypothetical protein